MPRALLVTVRFHDGRYHGVGDWPPSPARLFQALVAGAANGAVIVDRDRAALEWLETLAPPVIAVPTHRAGRRFTAFVPNNDLDAVGGDPRRVPEIRTAKSIKPRLFDSGTPFLYLWCFEERAEEAEIVCGIAERLYQLGRGVDMAFATGEVLEEIEAEQRLAHYEGAIHRPSTAGGRGGTLLPCPQCGSLESLRRRHETSGARFKAHYVPAPTKKEPERRKPAGLLFTRPPKPRFADVAYDSPPLRLLFDLRTSDQKADFAAWPLTAPVALVGQLRDAAERKLSRAMPDKAAMVERVFVGRNATEADKAARIRIIPLPSIGHPHAEPSIRRILVEIPPDCPLSEGDINWAFSGLDHHPDTGEVREWALVPAEDHRMLGHYAIAGDRRDLFRLWRTVTPAALPERAARRRIDPDRVHEDAKAGRERAREESRAATAVLHALRHAIIAAKVEAIRVQREPFSAKGARAEAFAPGTRFAKERLWHIEIAFTEPMQGPLVIGDGRYLGLGLMAPVEDARRNAVIFPLHPASRVPVVENAALLQAARRALMALSRDSDGQVPRLFSGHESDGAPASSGGHEHIFLAADDAGRDGHIDRLIVAAPWICDRSGQVPRRSDRALFDRVVSSFSEVRAGKLGVIALGPPSTLAAGDPVFGPARTWESRTPYHPTRHASRGKDPVAAVMQDVITECARRGLPRPEAEPLKHSAGPKGGGLVAYLRLRFAVAVEGPIMLGRDSHMGGGLFAAADEHRHAGR